MDGGNGEICESQESQSSGCRTWRIGVQNIHSLDGTKNHPFVPSILIHTVCDSFVDS